MRTVRLSSLGKVSATNAILSDRVLLDLIEQVEDSANELDELTQRLGANMLCTWLCIGTACAGFLAGGLLVLLVARLPTDKHTAL